MTMMAFMIVIGALVLLVGCAFLIGLFLLKPKKSDPLTYKGPILPKTYNDRYPKRSEMLVNNPPVEEEQPQPKSEVGPAQ